MKNILITGSKGFTGRYLINHLNLRRDKHQLYYLDVLRQEKNESNYIQCDLLESDCIERIISDIQPEIIYNLAGSMTNTYERDYSVNVLSTKSLFDAVLKQSSKNPRILIVGSSAEYGHATGTESVHEESALNPVSIYGMTKVCQTYLAKTYINIHHLDILIARPFNIIGQGMPKNMFIGNIESQIARYLKKCIEYIEVGYLNGYRDYVDISDVIRAYELIVEKGNSGDVYNVGSGKLIQMSQLLDMFLKCNNIANDVVKCKNQSDRISDDTSLKANVNKLKALGWSHKVNIEESIEKFMFEY